MTRADIRMTLERAYQLRAECETDLAEAERQRHSTSSFIATRAAAWINTLKWRLISIRDIIARKSRQAPSENR